MAAIFFDKLTAVDPRLIRQFYHGAVDLHDPAVDAVKLIDQGLDTVVVQVQLIHQLDDLRAQRLIGFFIGFGITAGFTEGCGNPRILHFREFDIIVCNPVEGFENLRL